MHSVTTRGVPPSLRLAYLHDFVSTQIGALRFAPRDVESFDYSVVSQSLGAEAILGDTRYSAVTVARDRRMVADGRANYILSIHDDAYEVEMSGVTHAVAPRQIVILNEGNPFGFRIPATRATILSLERRRIERMAPRIAGTPLHRLSPDGPDAALLAGYLALLNAHPPAGSVAPIADHVYELVARLLGRRDDRPPGQPAVAHARLRLVKDDIARNLTSPGLDVAAVARRQGITPRYVQKLFAAEGTTFSDHLRAERLAFAMHMLAAPGCVGRSIADIAFEAGFGDLSTFNRAFRARYGVTPREMRARAMTERG